MDSVHSNNHHVFETTLRETMLRNRKARTNGLEQIYRIPIVVHVVHNNSTDEVGVGNNISDKQIYSQIAVLNEDFRRKNSDTAYTATWARPVAADMQIEFLLATIDPNGNITNGITRHRTNVSTYGFDEIDEKKLKSFGYWPSDQYLNIWISPLSNNIIGYAQFPDETGLLGIGDINGNENTDGIVIVPHAFGRLTGKANGINNPYRFGRTTVHEIGHWLGLLHVFNDNENGCNYTDYCEDTPSQSENSLGLRDCDTSIIGSCASKIMFFNYMDYSNDACMNTYTKDQKNRVHAVLETSPRRAALKYSRAICGANNVFQIPFLEDFEDETKINKRWEMSVSDSLSEWYISDNELIAKSTQTTTQDSLLLKSGVFVYKFSDKYKLRFDLNANVQTADSIKIYYDVSCSEKPKLLATLSIEQSENKQVIIPLEKLKTEGLAQLFIVVYVNGNTYGFDNITIYTETNELEVTFYPNPVQQQEIQYQIGLPSEQEVTFELFDLQGKKVLHKQQTLFSGNYSLATGELETGTYLIKASSQDQYKIAKIYIE
jgi:hypothetical protein